VSYDKANLKMEARHAVARAKGEGQFRDEVDNLQPEGASDEAWKAIVVAAFEAA
jgi:hypothetical protein